ncbi:MAG: nicotinate-nucleotide adenylyltransferase, partial [Prochlorococcaceae cyanobacterium]
MRSPSTVAMLGTSADPPTRGHQALLEGLLNLYPRVATWASDNPVKD